MRTEKILVVDSNPIIRRQIWKCLQATGILIYQSDSVEKTLDMLTRIDFQLFLVDNQLKNKQGEQRLVELIRQQDERTPIIFMAEETSVDDIILGLENGADAYLTKPLNLTILKAQIMATLNRHAKNFYVKRKADLRLGDFRLDKVNYQFYLKEEPLKLSAKELQLLTFFLENANQVFSKEEIYTHVWKSPKLDANTLTVFINRLRNKIEEDPKKPNYLQTVWGIGYRFYLE